MTEMTDKQVSVELMWLTDVNAWNIEIACYNDRDNWQASEHRVDVVNLRECTERWDCVL